MLVNLDHADFSTPNQAFSTEKSGTAISSNDLNLEGMSQTPDLLPSRSPQLDQERSGSLPPKLKTETSKLENRLTAPAPTPKLREGAVENVGSECSEQSICRIRHEVEQGRTKDESNFEIAITNGIFNDPLHSGKQEAIAAPTVTEQLMNSGDTDSLPATDGVLNQPVRPLDVNTSDHEVQFEKEKARHEEKVSPLSTGTSARNSRWFSA